MYLPQRYGTAFAIFTLIVASQLFLGCSGPKQALEEIETTTDKGKSSKASFSDDASDLISSGKINTSPTNTAATPNAVATGTQAQCYNGLNYSPGLGGTNQFNDFSTNPNTAQTSTGTNSSPNSNGQGKCLASGGLNQQGVANMAMGTYNFQERCISEAMGNLQAASVKGMARREARYLVSVVYLGCLVRLTTAQRNSAQWGGNSLNGFGSADFNLREFITRLPR